MAQNALIDSLLPILLQQTESPEKIDVLNKLSWEFHRVDINQGSAYAQQAITLSKKLDYLEGLARAFNLEALCQSIQGNREYGYQLNEKAYQIAREVGAKKTMGEALNDMAIYLNENGQSEQALSKYLEALKIAEEVKDTLGICFCTNNIGLIYNNQGDTINAKKYFTASAEVGIKSGDDKTLAMALTNLGYLQMEEGQKQKAKETFDQLMEVGLRNQDKRIQIDAQMALGYFHEKSGFFELALQNEVNALNLAIEMKDKIYPVYIHSDMAHIYKESGQSHKAIRLAQKALEKAQELKLTSDEMSIHDLLIELYEETANYPKAFRHLQWSNALKDTLDIAEQRKEILALEARYQNEKKEIDNQLLREQAAKNEAQIERRKSLNFAAFLALILLSVIALGFYFAYSKKNTFNRKLQEQVDARTAELQTSVELLEKSNQELESFAYIASHDLKEPIRNIGGFAGLALRELQNGSTEQTGEYLSFIKENAGQMYSLIEDVLEYSKIGIEDDQAVAINLEEMIYKIEHGLERLIKERKAKIHYTGLPTIYANPTQLFILLKNLVENGLKYNEDENPVVSVSWKQKSKNYQVIVVKDNGIGIDPDYQAKVFEMFKRLHNRSEYQGSGLGLSICKKVVERMHGTIELASTPGLGSTFSITIPIESSAIEQCPSSLAFFEEN